MTLKKIPNLIGTTVLNPVWNAKWGRHQTAGDTRRQSALVGRHFRPPFLSVFPRQSPGMTTAAFKDFAAKKRCPQLNSRKRVVPKSTQRAARRRPNELWCGNIPSMPHLQGWPCDGYSLLMLARDKSYEPPHAKDARIIALLAYLPRWCMAPIASQSEAVFITNCARQQPTYHRRDLRILRSAAA